MAQYGIPTFDTLDQHTFIRHATELFETLGGALLTDVERLCGSTIRVDSTSLADRATRLGRGFYFGTPWLEREGYVLFPDFPVVPIRAYASFSEDFAAEAANREFIEKVIQEAKHFFRARDPEQTSVPVSVIVGLKTSKEIRPLNEMVREKNQSAVGKGRQKD